MQPTPISRREEGAGNHQSGPERTGRSGATRLSSQDFEQLVSPSGSSNNMAMRNIRRAVRRLSDLGNLSEENALLTIPDAELIILQNCSVALRLGHLLNFVDAADEMKYRLLMKEPWSLGIYPIPSFNVVGAISPAFVFSCFHLKSPYIFLAVGFFFCCFCLLATFVNAQLLRSTKPLQQQPQRFRSMLERFASYIVFKFIYGEVESIITITSSMAVSLFLLGRVIAGSCDSNANFVEKFSCNPVASSDALPVDGVLLLYIFPLSCQIFMRCVETKALVISWIISLCTHSITIGIVGVMQWDIFLAVVLMSCSYEIERTRRLMFLSTKASAGMALQAEQLIRLSQAEGELLQKEAEEENLRCLVGNVAHDLKTPLHLFSMDVQSLRDLSGDPTFDRKALRDACARLHSTVAFMYMVINRATDYTRASSGLALQPQVTSFDIVKVIEDQRKIVSQISDIEIAVVVSSMPQEGATIVTQILSDRQWFAENLLCLLSNATKHHSTEEDMIHPVEVHLSLTTSTDVVGSDHGVENFIKVSVWDRGPGVPVALRDAVFQPAHLSRRFTGGVGLGLYCLARRVEALGGSYGVSDRPDGLSGACFWFMFPYRADWFTKTSLERRHHNRTVANSPRSSIGDVSANVVDDMEMAAAKSDEGRSTAKVTTQSLLPHTFSLRGASNDDLTATMCSPYSNSPPSFQRVSLRALEPNSFQQRAKDQVNNRRSERKPSPLTEVVQRSTAESGRQRLQASTSPEQDQSAASVAADAITATAGVRTITKLMVPRGSARVMPAILDADIQEVRTRLSPRVNDSIHGRRNRFVSGGEGSQKDRNGSPRGEMVSRVERVSSGVSSGHYVSPGFRLNRMFRILVVDDASAVVKIMQRNLENDGHFVVTAKNGKLGLQKMQASLDITEENEFLDIVLMDIQMPVMDGLEAVRRFRIHEAIVLRRNPEVEKSLLRRRDFDLYRDNDRSRLLIIGMSANTAVECKEKAKAAGMDFFLEKPFTTHTFNSLIRRIMAGYTSTFVKSMHDDNDNVYEIDDEGDGSDEM